jgi:hypothetical protein
VFLDFDRTLASTRNGTDPLGGGGGAGGHSVDAELLAVLVEHPNAHVVTRNPHKENIQTFLRNKVGVLV